MNTLPRIKQFKLTNNDEIVCEVLEYDSPENAAIIMRGALRVIETMDWDKGVRFFGFKPWLTFGDDPAILYTLNSTHIIGEVTPGKKLLGFYAETIKDLKRSLAKRKSVDVNVNHLEEAIDTMSDEELDDYLDSKMIGDNDILDPDITKDSSGGGKILKFPSNITKH
jgi:hypothetical protein